MLHIADINHDDHDDIVSGRIQVVILMRPIAFAAAQFNLALHDATHMVPTRTTLGITSASVLGLDSATVK